MPRKLSPEEAAALGLPAPAPASAPRKLSPEEAAQLGLPSSAPSAPRAAEPAPAPWTEPAPRAKTSVGDAVGRAAAQGASIGIGDEAAGALDFLYEAGRRTKNNIEDALETSNPGELFVNPVEEGKHLLNTYRGTRDRERELNRRTAEDHPVAYGVTNVVTGIPAAIATGGASRAAPLVSGAIQGLTYSEAELTPDKVTGEDLVNANISMGMGAGMNKASAAFPNASKVVLPVVGGAQAAFGDKIGMSDADRVAAGTSAGIGAVSLGAEKVGNALQKKAASFNEKAAPAREQIAQKLQAKDDRLVGRAQNTANKEYVDQMSSVAGAMDARDKHLNKLRSGLSDLDTEEAAIQASMEGARAQAFQSLDTGARRGTETYTRKGLPVPPEVVEALDKADESYLRNLASKIRDPDAVAASHGEKLRTDVNDRRAKIQQQIEAFLAKPFDENSALAEAQRKVDPRVRSETAKKIAERLGLDMDGTTTEPPEGGFPLTSGAREKVIGSVPVADRVNETVELAVPGATRRIGWDALKGFGAGAGLGFGGATANVPLAQTLGPVAPVVGGMLGARHAIQSLTAMDPLQPGKFKNPVAAAGAYRAMEKALVTVPNLAKKYGAGWQRGMTPLQIVFYIQNDPELARALDGQTETAEP